MLRWTGKERIYIPQTDLPRFNISEADIAASRWSEDWAKLMDFEGVNGHAP